MITYRKLRVIRVAEFYFDEDTAAASSDVVRYLWRSAPLSGLRCEPSHTLVLDLANSPDTLLANMHRETRYRIRRAEKDHFRYEFWQAGEPEAIGQFCRFFDRFAARKHLVPANRQRLRALGGLGTLNLSRVSDAAGRTLVWHAHYCAEDRARGIYSASLLGVALDSAFRALIGRANCYHTWCDLLHYQQQGLSIYDLGGWYGGIEDQEKLRINRFKESFGGTVIPEFNAEAGITLTGRLALGSKGAVLSFLGRSRRSTPLPEAQGQAAPEIH